MANEERRDPNCRGPRLFACWPVEAALALLTSYGPNDHHDYPHKDEGGD